MTEQQPKQVLLPVLLTTRELAERWRLTDWTLRQWRAHGIGPAYLRLGPGRASEVRYRLADIEEYELAGRIVPGNPIPCAPSPSSCVPGTDPAASGDCNPAQ
jgi:hypothetical protein